ncbi:xylosidase [Streptomyces sp. 3MP-14]|uniref:Xylosidase n=1 Tax=Streptomyces mimosae TaxID=2586635 RepID=A0A5N6ABZ6_9ACTN|nr:MULTISPECIES: glycoside hydrolase family 71/99-like protein [Streptomyces]KAB8166347.1 xylosidase [Streptomyces mimosae]KAB8174140.1 xylosidase [Streptomyces sp. 3MP-14]
MLRSRALLRHGLALLLVAAGIGAAVGLPHANADAEPTAEAPAPTAGEHRITGQVYAGYQGWFAAEGDGSPINQWRHWNGSQPSPGNQTFEMWPDMSAYPASAHFPTGYAGLGSGEPATLFSSYPAEVTDQHFSWMAEYGIDGAALQRFGQDMVVPERKAQRDAITARARDAAERHDVGFYLEYDISGLTDENVEQTLKTDWTETATGTLALTDSPSYAHEDGRPVVAIFGFGFLNRPGDAATAQRVVEWFQDQGAYVIGAVPWGWRTETDTKPGFTEVYRSFDMLSPWFVGNASDLRDRMRDDRDDLASRGQEYLPVIYPGFSWANWNGGERNQIPRETGRFLWRQTLGVAELGIPQAFIAMFDEYDEATNIAPAASDSAMIPTDQYFQTTSADGVYASPDFYLRLAAHASRVITGEEPATPEMPVPLSLGPVHLRTGFERDVDAQPTWFDSPGPGGTANVTGPEGEGGPTLRVATGDQAATGASALRLRGATPDPAHSYAYLRALDVSIPVTAATRLSYDFLPNDEGGRHVAVDLVLDDGRTLRGSAATTQDGVDMHPAAPKGTVGDWTTITSAFGPELEGATIETILVGYDRNGATGGFDALIDNLLIENAATADE